MAARKPAPAKASAMVAIRDKVRSPAALAAALRKLGARDKKREVVFTNGCFDILHKGHVTYLERARKLGTHLVVALNADDSVRRLKGPERPINELADRLDVMAALASVDYVTWFEQDTPLELILKLKPDVLVKGGDWKAGDIVGGPEVRSWGGKVESLTYVEGKSTTDIIGKARLRAGKAPLRRGKA